MKVLHLPFNIASQLSVSVRGLRSIGIDARGLARSFSNIHDYSGLETMDWSGRVNGVARLLRGIRWRTKMIRAMGWADVIHWYFGMSTWRGLDLKIAARMKKPRLVEFWGDDLRDPERASQDNPYIARMYARHPEMTEGRPREMQSLFKRAGFECLIPGPELCDYLDPAIYPACHRTEVRLCLDDFAAHFPEPSHRRPVVAHAPSDKLKKGTEAVLAAIKSLGRSIDFEFKLIHQMDRPQALKVVSESDVFLDQFTIGAEGLAAYEAMALGKPAVCYIKPSLQTRYPTDFPMVVADQDNLEAVLAPLLRDGQRRHELGRASRQYVEKYHDARVVAAGLVKIYGDMLARTQVVADRSAR